MRTATALNSFQRFSSLSKEHGLICSCAVAFLCCLGCDTSRPTLSSETGKQTKQESTKQESAKQEFTESEDSLAKPALTANNEATSLDKQDVPLDQAESDRFREQLLSKVEAGANDNATPQELLGQLASIDTAIQELMTASANNTVDEAGFRQSGLRLGQNKLLTADKLIVHPDAAEPQRRSGQLAKLVALSHLSGFRDVDAAKELEEYATQLAQSTDLDLAHQSRVVLLGFQLQDLQNGKATEPKALIASAEALFTRPADLGFPELMTLLQASQVLRQMSFADEAAQIDNILITKYRQAEDPRLRAEAWNVETQGSQAVENFSTAFSSLGTTAFDPQSALAAARGLLEAFPSVQTLEQLAGMITNVEYSGNVPLSRELALLIETGLEQFPTATGNGIEAIRAVLASNQARLSTIGKPLALQDVVDFEGKPLNWSDYEGKVVLVDFWATWCTPCLKEIPEIRRVHELLHEKGFAVLSVNMDENLSTAKDFVLQRNFPWNTYHAADTNQLGFKSTFAKQYGITAIPFMILIGPDGNVADIHVRGERLFPSVQSLLGQPTSLMPENNQ